MGAWQLSERARIEGEDIAYAVFGKGEPLVLIHGFPGNAFSWREVGPRLGERWRVHVFDMQGFGASGKHVGQTVEASAQARLLAGLFGHWGLQEPLVAAHDIGAAAALGATLFEGCRYRRLILLDAGVLNPCMSSNSLHVRAHLEAYQTMPPRIYEQVLRAHIPTTMFRPMDEATFEGYFAPWRSAEGQAAYFRFIGQFDEAYLDRIEAALPRLSMPTRILWGAEDTWIPRDHGERLARLIPGASLRLIPGAGHFVMDDAPDAVADEIASFFAEARAAGPARAAAS